MLKAGLISAAVMFVLVLVFGAGVRPVCGLCVPILVGLLAGYLTGVFEKNPQTVVGRGAGAAAIAGVAAVVASLLASVIFGALHPGMRYSGYFGLRGDTPGFFWAMQLCIGCLVGLVNLALAAGLGALGGAIWKGTAGKTATPAA
ncbi:MAG TPA: hypothetical protein VK449_08025 [Anaerolineales bacterium]|nr:hypothetical protein [Anaerolineales bacterium]